jgi:hypothetical protein
LIAATLLARGDFALAWLGTSAVVMLVVGWSILQGADPLAGIKIDEQTDVAPIRGNS